MAEQRVIVRVRTTLLLWGCLLPAQGLLDDGFNVRVHHLHRLIALVNCGLEQWPHPAGAFPNRDDLLRLQESVRELVRGVPLGRTLDNWDVDCVVRVRQTSGEGLDAVPEQELGGGVEGKARHQILENDQPSVR